MADAGAAPGPIPPLEIRGRERSVRFPVAALLAPMDGVTDARFRGLVLDLGDAGGAVTEFVRITTGPIGTAALRRELGEPRAAPASGSHREPDESPGTPVGLQVMTPGPEHVAETAARAEEAGAAWVDINFGCPVKRVFNKCAGSALLAHPERVEAIVAAAAAGTGLPVSAKVRAGIDDASRLEEVLDAAASGGASMVTLHARLRRDSYATAARWEWIARAAAFLRGRHPRVALVGNGGVERAPDGARLLRETGCDGVMVGRAALADPWIFRGMRGGPPASAEESAAFALRWLDAVLVPGSERRGVGKAKMLLRAWRAGGLFEGREEERRRLLASPGAGEFREWLRRRAEGSPGTRRAPGGSPTPGLVATGVA